MAANIQVCLLFLVIDAHLSMDFIPGTTVLVQGLEENGLIYCNPKAVPGHRLSALSFDGDGDYVVFPNMENRCIGDAHLCSEGLTVSLWIYPHSKPVGESRIILSTMEDSTTDLGFSMTWSVNEDLKARVRTNSAFWVASTGETLTTGQWTHLCMVWNRTSTLNLYTSGVIKAVDQNPQVNTVNGTLSTLTLAARPVVHTRFLNASVDEVKIVESVLTASQIYRLYMDSFW